MTPDDVARGIARANADCEAALARASAVNVEQLPAYVISGDATGKRLIIPVRALAIGMARYMRAAYQHQHPTWKDPTE